MVSVTQNCSSAPATPLLSGTVKAAPTDTRLHDACVEFGSLITSQMLKEMRASVPDDGFMPRSQGEQIFQEMLDGEYAKTMSLSDTRGLATQLYRQLTGKGSSALSPESQCVSNK